MKKSFLDASKWQPNPLSEVFCCSPKILHVSSLEKFLTFLLFYFILFYFYMVAHSFYGILCFLFFNTHGYGNCIHGGSLSDSLKDATMSCLVSDQIRIYQTQFFPKILQQELSSTGCL